MHSRLFLLSVLVGCFFGTIAQAEKKLIPYYFNPVSTPKSVREAARDCMYRSDACRAAVEAAGTYVGIPPGAIYESMKTADKFGFGVNANKHGEQTDIVITAPKNWTICNVEINPISASPAGGKRSPTFSISIQPDRIGITLFVHRLGLFQGRSWWDGALAVTYISGPSVPADGCIFATKKQRHRKISYICRGRDGYGDHPGCAPRRYFIKPR